MNASLRGRLFRWLATAIVASGALAAALSFVMSYRDANDLQDAQLAQIAAVLAGVKLAPGPVNYKPRDHEDAEMHIVIKLLGPAPSGPDPDIDLALPDTLVTGLQSLKQADVGWRVIVARNTAGQRFGVAQRMHLRDETARDAALITLLPLLVLVPFLLVMVGVLLRQAFAPLNALSAEVDRLDGSRLSALDERPVSLEALPLVQAVNRLMRRLALVLEQQRRLVSDAAHELRTPVAALIVQADNVRHVPLPGDATERMDVLQQGLARMSSLIDQLLRFARLQGTEAAPPQRLDLDALVRTAIEESLPWAQAKRVDLGCLCIDSAAVLGDPMHAYALVRNAVDNAVRYTPPGGSVDISVSVSGGQACLVIEDTGPGIAPQDLERVFEPFVRVLGSQEPGSGLGLAIARTAAQALGGSIELGRRGDGASGLRFVYRQATA